MIRIGNFRNTGLLMLWVVLAQSTGYTVSAANAQSSHTQTMFRTRLEKVPNTKTYAPYKQQPEVQAVNARNSTATQTAATQVIGHGVDSVPAAVSVQVPGESGGNGGASTADVVSKQVPFALTGQVEDSAIDVVSKQLPFELPIEESMLQPEATPPERRGLDADARAIFQNAPRLQNTTAGAVADSAYHSFVASNFGNVANSDSDVLVFKGKWDHAERLLNQAKIAYTTSSRRSTEQQLQSASIVILNCPAELEPDEIYLLRQFVARGGYLISTDWALDGSVDKVFPGYLTWKGAYSNHETVDAVTVDPSNDLTKGLPQVAPWRLADKCEIVSLSANNAIEVLIRSRQLSHEDPNGVGILACTFPFGRGRVLHLVGHFENNEGTTAAQDVPDQAPSIKISMRQALALNFICRALAAHGCVRDRIETAKLK